MAALVEMPPRVFNADARPTMLYDVGLQEHEAQWVADESRSIVPGDSSTGRRIRVRFIGEDFSDDFGVERGGYYSQESAEIRCNQKGENLGVVLHELAHAQGLRHYAEGGSDQPQPDDITGRLQFNRPFREVHAQLLEFWEGRLGVTRLNDIVVERSQQLSEEMKATVERFNKMIQGVEADYGDDD